MDKWRSLTVVSRAKDAVNVDDLVPDLVRINQYRILAANVELLEASDCTMTEAYELLKNMHFLDDPCSIQAYIKNRLFNTDLETILNCSNSAIAPTTYALLQNAQPTSAAVERSFSMLSKLLRKDRNFDVKKVKKYLLLYYNKELFLTNVLCNYYYTIVEERNKLDIAVFIRAYRQNSSFFEVKLSCTDFANFNLRPYIKTSY